MDLMYYQAALVLQKIIRRNREIQENKLNKYQNRKLYIYREMEEDTNLKVGQVMEVNKIIQDKYLFRNILVNWRKNKQLKKSMAKRKSASLAPKNSNLIKILPVSHPTPETPKVPTKQKVSFSPPGESSSNLLAIAPPKEPKSESKREYRGSTRKKSSQRNMFFGTETSLLDPTANSDITPAIDRFDGIGLNPGIRTSKPEDSESLKEEMSELSEESELPSDFGESNSISKRSIFMKGNDDIIRYKRNLLS